MNRHSTAGPLAAGALLTAVALLGAGCSSQSTQSFDASGTGPSSGSTASGQAEATTTPGSATATGSAAVTMPSFGANVHIVLGAFPKLGTADGQALVTDLDYQLDFLYADYTGGRSQTWINEVNPTMVQALQSGLAQPDVTTESFTGTIRLFRFSVIKDPVVKGDLDVTGCMDNAGAVNTDLKSGAVLPGQSVTDHNYFRYSNELAPVPGGGWQVVENMPDIYFPLAGGCKP
jgi:hypothetical protein